jgi:hypothetical protein
MYGGGDLVRPNDPQAAVQLQEGKTFRYPRLVVQSQFGLNLQDWDRIDIDSFVLEWQGFTPPPGAKVQYELEMFVSAPRGMGRDAKMMPVLRTEKEMVATTRWPVGEKGVGGLRLAPGNIYMFQVSAVDEAGKVLAQWQRTRAWTPWSHRNSEPPATGITRPTDTPIEHEAYYRGVFHRDGRKESLPERVDGYLREQPNAFEFDYVRVGKAWLDWHDGKTKESRGLLFDLIRRLPKGNVAHTTAIQLLTDMEYGQEPRRRLEFIAPPKGEEMKLPGTVGDGTVRW